MACAPLGMTVAVLGCGIDRYPSPRSKPAAAIGERGTIRFTPVES